MSCFCVKKTIDLLKEYMPQYKIIQTQAHIAFISRDVLRLGNKNAKRTCV